MPAQYRPLPSLSLPLAPATVQVGPGCLPWISGLRRTGCPGAKVAAWKGGSAAATWGPATGPRGQDGTGATDGDARSCLSVAFASAGSRRGRNPFPPLQPHLRQMITGEGGCGHVACREKPPWGPPCLRREATADPPSGQSSEGGTLSHGAPAGGRGAVRCRLEAQSVCHLVLSTWASWACKGGLTSPLLIRGLFPILIRWQSHYCCPTGTLGTLGLWPLHSLQPCP